MENKDTNVFDGSNCIFKLLESLVTSERETKKLGKTIVEYELQLIAHKVSAIATYVVSNSSSNWHRILT